MSHIQRLQTAVGMALMFVFAGAVSAIAQAQTVSESSLVMVETVTPATSNPKKAVVAKTSDNTTSDKISEISRDRVNSNTVDVADDPTVPAKARSETAAPGPQSAPNDEWQFQVTPYFWMAGLHGTAGIGNRTADVDESFSDVFHALNFFIMGTFEARKGKLVSLTDVEYVSLSDDKATPGPLFSNVNANFKLFIFDQEVGYRVFDDPDKEAFIDVMGGVRVWHVSTELDFGAGILPATTVQGSRNWVDGVGGLRGKAAVSEKVFVTGKLDLGGGGSNFSYQLFGAAGYNITPKIALIFGYRVLDVNYNKNNFIYDINQRGPIVGVGFKF